MLVHMMCRANFWLNVFPPTPGVLADINPRELITGLEIDHDKHWQVECGACGQVHEEHDDSMRTRTAGSIAMRPTGNTQGGCHFRSLNTGRTLDRLKCTLLPMPSNVTHTLAKNRTAGVTFTDRRGEEHDDDPDHIDDDDNDDASSQDDKLDASIAGVDEDKLQDPQQPPDPPIANDNQPVNNECEDMPPMQEAAESDDEEEESNDEADDKENEFTGQEEHNTNDEEASHETSNDIDAEADHKARDKTAQEFSNDATDNPQLEREMKKINEWGKAPKVPPHCMRQSTRNAAANTTTDSRDELRER